MQKIRLLLADDHQEVRIQIKIRLCRETDMEIVGEAANSMQAIKFALVERPQVILIDPCMRDGRGIEAIGRIRARLPDVTVVVLTSIVDAMLRVELHRLGVRHFLCKEIPSIDLIQTLRERASAGPTA